MSRTAVPSQRSGGGAPLAGRGANAATCFKCGKTGHWARDCAAPPEEWVSRSTNEPANQRHVTSGSGKNENQEPGAAAEPPLKKPATKKTRPKLTWENLTGPVGIGYVYTQIPQQFRRQFKGRGHEAGDLGRLLELYHGWQRQIYPNAKSFDEFVSDVEKFSSQHLVKTDLREMRKNVLKLAGVDLEQQPGDLSRPAAKDATEINRGASEEVAQPETHEPDHPELDDDELLELQAQGLENEVEVAPMEMLEDFSASAMPQQRQRGGAPAELDEDELAALHDEMMAVDNEPGSGEGKFGGLDADEMAELEEELGLQAEEEDGSKGAVGRGQQEERADGLLDQDEITELEEESALQAEEEGGRKDVGGGQEEDGADGQCNGVEDKPEEAAHDGSGALAGNVQDSGAAEQSSIPPTDLLDEQPPTPGTPAGGVQDAEASKAGFGEVAKAESEGHEKGVDMEESGKNAAEGEPKTECPETEIATEPVPMESLEDTQLGTAWAEGPGGVAGIPAGVVEEGPEGGDGAEVGDPAVEATRQGSSPVGDASVETEKIVEGWVEVDPQKGQGMDTKTPEEATESPAVSEGAAGKRKRGDLDGTAHM